MDIICVIKKWCLIKAKQIWEPIPLKKLFIHYCCCIKSIHSKINHFSLTKVQNGIKLTNNTAY